MDGLLADRPITGDAFGRALEAHHTGGEAVEFVERDDGYLDVTGVGTYFTGYSEWSTELQQAMEHASGRILDVGCGAGRIALYVQELSHEVVGIDVSQRAIDVCRDRGLHDARVLDSADVRSDAFDGPFETVLLCGNNFGLVGTGKTAPDLLGRLADITTADATVIAQSVDPTSTDNPAHRAYHQLNRERGRLPGALRIRVRHGRYATPWYDYLLAGPDTMRDLVAPTAWHVTDVIDPNSSVGYVGVLRKE